MIRKSLFWGLTLVLIVALVGLIIRGRSLEKKQSNGPVEIVQKSKPTATRVLTPSDLELLQSTMKLERQSDTTGESRIAHHKIEIRNNGKVVYEGIQLSFDYLDRSGKRLAVKHYFIAKSLLPASTLTLDDVRIEDIPIKTADFRATVDYADIGQLPDSRNK
jgi:hypothetical protein